MANFSISFRPRTIFLILLAAASALLTVAWVGAAPRQAASDPAHPFARKIPAPGIPNFAEVTPTLYRGAQPTTEGLETLKKMGVDIVVDMRGGKREGEERAIAKLGMTHVSMPWHCPSPRDETFARFLTLVRDNPGKKIFVHCRLGQDRTGMAIASYRMSEQGWSADEAMKEMQSFGFSTAHYAMCFGLADYEQRFPQRLKTGAAFKDLRTQTPNESK